MSLIVISPDPDLPATSFIKAHYKFINGVSDYLYSGFPPTKSLNFANIGKITIKDKIVLHVTKQNYTNYIFERYLRKHKIKNIIAEYGPTAVSVLESCEKLNIRLIPHFHGFDVYEKKIIETYIEGYKKLFEYAPVIVAVSHDMKKELCLIGAPADKIIVNPCGPDMRFFDIKPDYNSNSFISIGRFVDKKAPYLTLMAFRKVVEKHPEMKLQMVGDGVLMNTCKNLCKKWNIEKNVIFYGNIPHNEIVKLLKNSFCFVQHSIVADNGDSEGTPVSVSEAGAASLPVIATKHKGIGEVILNNQTGILVDEMDTNAMTEAMLKVAADRKLAQHLGEKSHKRIKKYFSMEHHINVLNEIT